MNTLSIVWDVSPKIFSIGALEVRWYGLLWAIGFILAYQIVAVIFKKEKLPDNWVDKLFLYCMLGTIIGARLGHCFFYDAEYYLAHPAEIIKIWHGGLASHGGALGVIFAVHLFSKKIAKENIWFCFDRMIIGVAALCFCIRLGNLMNSEIFGYPTSLPWGFEFVRSREWHQLYEGQACHPTQIYEMLYCLAAGLIAWLMYAKGLAKKRGLITGVSLQIFFLTRFLLEFMKNPQVEREANMILDIGQLLSIPFILLGIWLIVSSLTRK